MTRPLWLDATPRRVPPSYWDGWTDCQNALRKQLTASLEHVEFLGLAGANEQLRPSDRPAVQVATDALRVLLEDIHRGDVDVLDQCRLLVDCDPDAAAEALQLLAWAFAGKPPSTAETVVS